MYSIGAKVPVVNSFTAQPISNNFTLKATGIPQYPFFLQTTTNLAKPIAWNTLYTNFADALGNVSFSLSNLPANQQFFRVLSQQ